MLCPHCKKELELAGQVLRNIDAYGEPALATTLCCNNPVRVQPVRSFTVSSYMGTRTMDDWGHEFKRSWINQAAAKLDKAAKVFS